jgi:Flp pilus assembly protein TadD
VRFGVCVFLSFVLVGCGARGPFRVTADTREGSQRTFGSPEEQTPAQSLESFIAKVRTAAAETKPPEHQAVTRAESADPLLTAALAIAASHPSPETYRAVAIEYVRLGIKDKAHEYVDKAVAMSPSDSANYEARARLWRDGGFADRALSDAHRAVYFGPGAASARNTLGTVLQALGRRTEARQQFERALTLDPRAAYALNNLCYAWLLEHQPAKAAKACEAAIAIDPALRAARNNLGLAYAAGGNIDAARRAFEETGDRAAAEYNLGIVQLARGRFNDAVTAFAAAQQIRPYWRIAAVRGRQAQQLARAGADQ